MSGIGRKSANMILYNAFGINEGIAVDRHVLRVSQRLGLTKQQKPEKAEEELMKIVPIANAPFMTFAPLKIYNFPRIEQILRVKDPFNFP